MTTEADLQAFNRCYAATQWANKRDEPMDMNKVDIDGRKYVDAEPIMTADELWEKHGIRCRPIGSNCIAVEKMVKDSVWENASITPYHPNMLAARRAATKIVRLEQKPKVERVGRMVEVGREGFIEHSTHKLYRITDPDVTARVVQRVVQRVSDEELEALEHWDDCNPVSDGFVMRLADQRLIREQEDDNG